MKMLVKTPTEALSDAKETLQAVEQALNGEHVDETSLDNIKEEFQSIFDEHKGDLVGALREVKEVLEDELSPLGKSSLDDLTKALEDISTKSSDKYSEEHPRKRAKTSEASKYSESSSVPKDDSSSEASCDSTDGMLE
jgi:hypothetical protein